jgi:hypothetical protein
LARVEHWTAARWTQPSPDRQSSRADVMFALVQRLADVCAAAEDRVPRPVPRLDNDLALPDQLKVMVVDLLMADAPATVLQAAAADIEATAANL